MSNLNYRSLEIGKCRACNSSRLKPILSLGDQYLSDFTKGEKKPEKYPLDLILCDNCALLQLKHNAPQSSLYTERYGYKSGMNKTMQVELKEIVEKALVRLGAVKGEIVVVDIGANDGTLLSNYGKKVFKIGVEPIKKFAKECQTKADVVINDFFNYQAFSKKVKVKRANIVTVISCFYDMENPNQFLSDIRRILNDEGILVIQQNYLVGMLRQNAFDNIVHEHLEYYSLLSLKSLLENHGLEVFDVEQSGINGGSFRTYIGVKNKRKISKEVINMLSNEKRLGLKNAIVYKQFVARVKEVREKLYNFLVKLSEDKKTVYVYGASTRGNTLLQYCDLDNKLIAAAVERNPEKWGKKISSVNIPIISEEEARMKKPDYMLVLPWFFKDEFIRREKRYLEDGGHFIFPLPKLKVI